MRIICLQKTLHKSKPQPIDGPIGNISRNTVYFVIELAPLSASNCFFLLLNQSLGKTCRMGKRILILWQSWRVRHGAGNGAWWVGLVWQTTKRAGLSSCAPLLRLLLPLTSLSFTLRTNYFNFNGYCPFLRRSNYAFIKI